MDKTNQFRSSNFHMDEGDILHLILIDETGTPVTIDLQETPAIGEVIEDVPGQPLASAATNVTSSSFTANWNFMQNSSGYYLDVATDTSFTALVLDNHDAGNTISHSVTGLTENITYYYRVRAYNEFGTSIDSEYITQKTMPSTTATDIDGNVYTTVTIGTRQWMVENLRVTKYADGTTIPNLTADADWIAEDGTTGHNGAYSWYNNDSVVYNDYGLLYNWYAVTNLHQLAPTGWRVANSVDYDSLAAAHYEGFQLKELGSTHWNLPNDNTNESGLTLIGGGTRQAPDGLFRYIKEWCELWTSNSYPTYEVIPYNIGGNLQENAGGGGGFAYVGFGHSVRCVRDI
jgi:uncharacterized protein (TIGR02145 family)